MERQIKLTPKEQRSRDSWRAHLARFQYENGLSVDQMNEELNRQKEEKIKESDAVIDKGTDPPPIEETNSLGRNAAYFVLTYLTRDGREKRKHNSKTDG